MNYLPDFLIIGAMKSGTTSLFRDLSTQSQIFFPLDKEPGFLRMPIADIEKIKKCYSDVNKKMKPFQLAGDASTVYTKLPDNPGIAATAKKVAGDGLKIIYIIRDPVARIISHHHHDYHLGRAGNDINREVFTDPKYINYSSYAMQLAPWLDQFGDDNVHIIIFEEYIKDRTSFVQAVMFFLEKTYNEGMIDEVEVFNRSKGKVIMSDFWKKIITSDLYRDTIRPYVPGAMRESFQKAVLQKTDKEFPDMNKKTVEALKQELNPEVEKIKQFLERKSLWYC